MFQQSFLSVGIDVGSEVSWASIVTPDHKLVFKPIKIDHHSLVSLESFKNAIKKAEEVNSLKAHVFLESTGIYHIPLFYHLTEAGFKTFILNPLITDSNKNQGIRKVKNDKSDATRIAITGFSSNLKTSLIPSDMILDIRALTREYHKLADERTAYLNQITKELAMVFPGYSKVFSSILSKTSVAILKEFKCPKALLNATKEHVLTLIRERGKQGPDKSLKVYEKLIEAAKLAMVFSHQLNSSYEIIALKLNLIDVIDNQKASVLSRIQSLLKEQADSCFSKQVELLESINGVGFISAVSLMSEIGDFKAFSKPKQLVAYFGLDPSVKQSGKFVGTKNSMSKRGSRIARRVLFIVAVASIRNTVNGISVNPVIQKYYKELIERKPKKVAIGAIMRKMTNVIFAVLRNNKPYAIQTPEEHIKQYNSKLHLAA